MKFETIILTKKDAVATITLNRPEARNAVNDRMWQEMALALDDVAGDKAVRVLVLTGAGQAFCGGADLKGGSAGVRMGVSGEALEEVRQWLRQVAQPVTLKLVNMDKPTIAVLNGVAVGGGFDWALACDMRIGSEHAKFIEAYTNVAAAVGTGGLWLLPRIVGLPKALEIIYTGKPIDAKEAERIGLLNMVIPSAELEKKTMELATKIAQGPPLALGQDKRVLYDGLKTSLESALEMAATAEAITLVTEDHQEGVNAFLQKRKPVFRGK